MSEGKQNLDGDVQRYEREQLSLQLLTALKAHETAEQQVRDLMSKIKKLPDGMTTVPNIRQQIDKLLEYYGPHLSDYERAMAEQNRNDMLHERCVRSGIRIVYPGDDDDDL
jgi:septum formation inhibitor MinC